MANKGPPFEREFCRRLSRWWSGDEEQDDLFWRSSQSGGRATVRGRKGKKTRGHCGDIAATDSAGQPLTDFVTFELKRGYNRCTVHDLLDKGPKAKTQCYEEFFDQAREAAKRAGTPHWLLAHKRDRREALVFFPYDLFDDLRKLKVKFDRPGLSLMLVPRSITVIGMTLDGFFGISPDKFRTLIRRG